MNPKFADQDRAELARILPDVISAGYPFSPKVRRWKELLSKLDPTAERVVTLAATAEAAAGAAE
jgi:hypothetical protein